ncbi:MAG: hypothetical protein CME38_14670 [Haliea sp.]|nr:hypothetical protein [Haliea sp.]
MQYLSARSPRAATGGLVVIATTAVLSLAATNEANAQSVSACPNVIVGSSPDGVSVYSDCTMENAVGQPGFHLTLSANSGAAQVLANGYLATSLSPAPAGDVSFGRWDGITLYTEDMGPGYAGNCLDMTSTSNSIPLVDQAVYCGRVGNEEGNFVLLRGTWDAGGNTFNNPAVFSTQPGVGEPVEARAIPALPGVALGLLGLLMAALGRRHLGQR